MNPSHSPRFAAPSRRTLAKGVAWSVPALAASTFAPAVAVSPTDIRTVTMTGTCGILGVIGPGFVLTAGSGGLPRGTSIVLTGSGVASIGVLTITGGTVDIDVLSPTSRVITVTAPVAAGAALDFRTALSLNLVFTLDASLSLPDGITAGPGSKTSATVSSTTVLCSAN